MPGPVLGRGTEKVDLHCGLQEGSLQAGRAVHGAAVATQGEEDQPEVGQAQQGRHCLELDKAP